MTCGSCELLLERKLKMVHGVTHVDVDHRKGIAIITANTDALPSSEEIEGIIRSAGYGVGDEIPTRSVACGTDQNGILDVWIDGMTCKNCENLIKQSLKRVPGVKHASVHHQKGSAKIHYTQMPDWDDLRDAVQRAGYRIRHPGEAPSRIEPSHKKWMEIGGSLLVIFALYKLLQAFDLVSLTPSTSGALSFGGIFAIGLVAGTSSCLAVTGGLLLALAAKHNELHQAETPWEKFRPLLHFNIGRLVSYFVLGGLVGLLGQSITLSTKMSGYMSILVAFIMLWLALTILQIVPKGSFPIRPPKRLSRWIAGLSESDHPLAPASLGALTFFLPCGFTQSLQLVALASGSFSTGAMTMFIFALGTLPSLVGLGAISSAAKGAASRLFLRFSGALVLVLALFNINSGFALTGFNFSSLLKAPLSEVNAATPPIVNGVQQAALTMTPSGFDRPLTIKAGIPVELNFDGTYGQGCRSFFVISALDLSQQILPGPNVVTFTAPNPGRLVATCSMGMYPLEITVL